MSPKVSQAGELGIALRTDEGAYFPIIIILPITRVRVVS